MNLNCKIGLESVIKSVSLQVVEDNNVKCSTDVPANQEPFKNSENKEGENSRVKTYKELNCVTCEKTLHEESSLVGHKRDSPDIKASDKCSEVRLLIIPNVCFMKNSSVGGENLSLHF